MPRRAGLGVGQTQETAFRVPQGSIGYWTHRFVEKGVPHEAPEKRFGETVLPFTRSGRHGPRAGRRRPAPRASRPGAAARCRPSTRSAASTASPCCSTTRRPTGAILTDVLGFSEAAREGSLVRFQRRRDAVGGIVDIREAGASCPAAGRRLGAPRRLPGRGRRRAGRDGGASSPRITASHRPSRRTATTSARSTSASPAASCSRSRPTPGLCRRRAGRDARRRR